jgi:hypothetical protein
MTCALHSRTEHLSPLLPIRGTRLGFSYRILLSILVVSATTIMLKVRGAGAAERGDDEHENLIS